jgi:putative transposase
MEQLLDTGEVGRPRRDADEPRLIGEEQAEALIAQAREHGVELLGEQGLLRQMTQGGAGARARRGVDQPSWL